MYSASLQYFFVFHIRILIIFRVLFHTLLVVTTRTINRADPGYFFYKRKRRRIIGIFFSDQHITANPDKIRIRLTDRFYKVLIILSVLLIMKIT